MTQGGTARKPGIAGLLPLENLEYVSERSNTLWQLILGFVATVFIFAYDASTPASTIPNLPFTTVAVAIAFFPHMMVQMWIARRFGIDASYRLWLPGFASSLLLTVVGFRIALIGAAGTLPYKFSRWGHKQRPSTFREIGWIGGSGPLYNILMGGIFGLLSLYTGIPAFGQMMVLNGWMAFYGLIPISGLDGGNMFFWKPSLWFLMVVLSVLLLTPYNLLSTMPA